MRRRAHSLHEPGLNIAPDRQPFFLDAAVLRSGCAHRCATNFGVLIPQLSAHPMFYLFPKNETVTALFGNDAFFALSDEIKRLLSVPSAASARIDIRDIII